MFILNRHKGMRSVFLLLLALAMLAVSGCTFIPDDMVNTLPSATTTVETTTSETTAPIIDNPILVTEIMTTNRSILQTADQNTPDWIEFYNSGSTAVNLDQYGLSDNLNKPMKWTFPAVVIKPGDYLIVYASGITDVAALSAASAKGELHASFKLNGSGDELIFCNATAQVLARLSLPAIPADLSYGLLDSATSSAAPYYFFGAPTPGSANNSEGFEDAEDAQPVVVSHLVINEFITNSTNSVDLDGDRTDWVELLNTGSEPFSLLGSSLSDNPDDPEKWVFPDVTIEPGSLLVVWLTGKETAYDPGNPLTLQASFQLGGTDTLLILTDAKGNQLIRQDVAELPLNVSRGRSADDREIWLYFPKPTPGQPNLTQGFAELEGAMTLSNRGIWINEVMALDAVRVAGGKEVQADWIELYNGLPTAVDLTGYGLSDKADEPYRMSLDGLTLDPGSYLVVEPTAFALDNAGETLYLTAPDRVLVDWFRTGKLANGQSSGRGNSGGSEPADSRFFYVTPTRGTENASPSTLGRTLAPVVTAVRESDGAAQTGLYLDGPVRVTLSCAQPDVRVFYTLNGSLPDAASNLYTQPLVVDSNTVIRCIAVADGYLPSETVYRTFLAGTRHDLPVVSILAREADFFDPNTGLWTNFQADLEHPADISFYETDGTHGVDFTAGIALHGSYSRTEKQKSMELNLREMYGDSQVTYPFFPGNEVSSFKRLLLRTSGQDWRFTKLRDAFMTEVVKGFTELDTMDWRACAVYLNGAYFGLYYIRENVDEYYMAAHHGADPANIDIIKGNKIMLEGTYDAYDAMLSYVRNHDMRDDAAYQHVLSLIDEESLMDFLIVQTFFNNLDSGNKKFWRENKDGAEWRWVLFDMDWAMFPTTYEKNILKYDLLDPAGHGQQNIFSTTLQVRLLENPGFKQAFIERYAWFLNNVFLTERMLGILDEMTENIRSEMPRQIEKWKGPSSLSNWEYQVSELRRITSEKRSRMVTILQETFNIPADQMRVLFPEDA